MPRAEEKDGLSKFQRYRETQRRKGMKLLRLWVPNPRAPGFKSEAERQGKLLRGRPEERETLEFIDRGFAWPEA